MCGQRDIAFISHSENIDRSKHLNEAILHLNYNRENFVVFLKKFN